MAEDIKKNLNILLFMNSMFWAIEMEIKQVKS